MSDFNEVFDKLNTSNEDALTTKEGETVTANQSTYSFDEVEALTFDDDEAILSKKAGKEPESKENNQKEDKGVDGKEEQKINENEGIEEEVEDEQRESGKEEKEEKPAKSEDYKKISAKFNDESLDIPADALIPHKVDGEEVEVPLQELLNNYSGKQAWDKRFSELDRERREYRNEKELVERYVNEFAELAKGDDKLAAMEYLAQFAGMDPIEFRRQLRSQVLEKYGNYQEMSEIERKALDQEEELSYHKRVKESELKQQAEQQTLQELESQLLEIQKTHDLTDSELQEAYEELSGTERYKNGDEQITPEALSNYVQTKNAWFSAKDAISEVSEQLLEKEGFIEDVTDMILSNPELEIDDVKDVIRQFAGQAKKKSPQQKASDKVREKESGKSLNVAKEDKETYYSFDELDF